MAITSLSHSFQTLWTTLNNLKKVVIPLLNEGYNTLSALDFDRLETWALTSVTDIDFERAPIYNGLNRLYKEAARDLRLKLT